MFKSSRHLLFANYLQLPTVMPQWVWRLLRMASGLSALSISAMLALRPDLGLPVFWGLTVPALPLVFMFAPGLWRNICPLATSNQTPRRSRFLRAATQRTLSQRIAYPIGVALLIAAVIGRRLLFNVSGVATAALIVGAMLAAFVGGLLFKGKSGWCSSICPLLPVQRLYGQTPFVRIANTQCEPCVGCTKNCYDFNPGAAYLADQYDPDPAHRNVRRFFAGVFPGLVLGYYLVPPVAAIGALSVVLQMLTYMAGSLTLFTLVDLLVGKTRNGVPVAFGAVAFSIYYWYATPIVSQTLEQLGGYPLDTQVVGALRAIVIVGGLVWIARSLHVERVFLRDQVRKSANGDIRLAPIVIETVRLNRNVLGSPKRRKDAHRPVAVDGIEVSQPVPLDGPVSLREPGLTTAPTTVVAPTSGPAELCIAPLGTTTPIRNGQTLLDVLESCGAAINAGCRAGACGADPIAVTAGSERLAPIGGDERATLQRLGCADNTRLACMARVRNAGPITVELKPHAKGAARPGGGAPSAEPPPTAIEFDRSIRRVVIIGNGVAGLTAADHVRRNHPECEIDLIGRENHNAYNRMAIAKLISTPTGVSGLHLLPEQWYAEHRVTAWLNTHVTGLDTERREVTLATRKMLPYDRLILATGSSAQVPPMDGYGMDGSFVLRDADDAMTIRDHMQRRGGTAAAVIGAGLLGLEAAQALTQLGAQVMLLAKSEQLLDRQIDAAASELLVAHLGTQGITVVPKAKVLSLERDGHGRLAAVALADGRKLPTDAVVVCTGSRANVDLARSAGLALGRGITVDEHMRTSDPFVYAAGDAAEFEGASFGLWAVAMEQGEIAALNALGSFGGPRVYRGHVPVTALKVSGIDVRSAGAVHAERPGEVELTQLDAAQAVYRKLVVADGKLVGAVLVGASDDADEIIQAVRERAAVSTLGSLLQRGNWRRRSRAIAA